MEWSLAPRSKSISALRRHHFRPNGDFVKVARDKTETGGAELTNPKHAHASPLNPLFCAIFTLGARLSAPMDRVAEGDPLIFKGATGGNKTHKSFHVALARMLRPLEEELSQAVAGLESSAAEVEGRRTAAEGQARSAESGELALVQTVVRRHDRHRNSFIEATQHEQYRPKSGPRESAREGRVPRRAQHPVYQS